MQIVKEYVAKEYGGLLYKLKQIEAINQDLNDNPSWHIHTLIMGVNADIVVVYDIIENK